MTICGSVVLDIVQHFVERWNEIKKRKYRNDTYVEIPVLRMSISCRCHRRFDWLALPHDVEAAPNESVARQ